MRKQWTIFVACVLLCAAFAGCTQQGGTEPHADAVNRTNDRETDGGAESVSGDMSLGAAAAASFGQYQNAEMVVLNGLEIELSSNEPEASLSLLGLFGGSAYVVPLQLFGNAQDFSVGMESMGNKRVTYNEGADSFSLSYRDAAGVDCELTGTYDAAADALSVSAKKDGATAFLMEYRKTGYGYVAQYCIADSGGAAVYYALTTTGTEGMLGIGPATGDIPALTGNEAPDFPQSCAEWYALGAAEVSGVGPDGISIRFDRTQ